MKMDPHPSWNELRTAYRPPEPDLDTAAIMDAVRLEAVAKPLHPFRRGPVAAIPAWACAAAASLALWMAAVSIQFSGRQADRILVEAWMLELEIEQLEAVVQTVSTFALTGGDEI